MGILSSIGSWVSSAISVARNVVKAADVVLSTAADVVDALLQGRVIINPSESSTEKTKTMDRPDIMGSRHSNINEIEELHSSIDENKKKLSTIKNENELEHRKIQLQIDIMELIVSASTFERFANNINLHASNLNIHLQTIQNTAGLLDSVNRQRVAIKALMGTINHLINITGSDGVVKKLEGIDIDIRPDSISINNVYKSFEYTRSLLVEEIDSFSKSIQEQMNRIDAVKEVAKSVPDSRHKINQWLSNAVEPKLISAQKQAEKLKSELLIIPRLENKLRHELEQNFQEDSFKGNSEKRQVPKKNNPDFSLETGAIISLKNGFGFIKNTSNPENLYFHCSSLVETNFNSLNVHDKVKFKTTKNEKGEEIAVNVYLIN